MKRKEDRKHFEYSAKVGQRERTLDKTLEQVNAKGKPEKRKENSSEVNGSRKEGKIRYFKATLWIALAIVILAFFSNTKCVIENIEYIKDVITDIDECASYPCLYGGKCVDRVAGYECNCHKGYSGKNCETDEACVNHQCKNGGTCVSRPDGSYTCICHPHLAGIFYCEEPKPIPHGSVVVNEEEGTKYGSKASVVCSRGFTSSKPEATCQENGKWSSVYCHVTDCGSTLPVIENGQSTINEEQDTTFGATASVTCAPGYQRNKAKVSCQATGMWEDATCKPVDCGIPIIEHGYLEKDNTLFMSQASVKCYKGYTPSQPKVTCTASGTWQQAECYNVDDCANNPCLNGGQCEDKVSDYVCKCQRWYSGKNCEISEACANHKCQCGGTCVAKMDGSYECACPPHIDGLFCERPHSGKSCH